eukprot:gene13375-19220_t
MAITKPPRESLLECAKRPYLDVAPEISGALFYLDAGAAEHAQLSLGLPFLFGLGATNVCELERACPDDALMGKLSGFGAPTTLAIFTTQLLPNLHQHIQSAVSAHRPTLSRLIIFSAVSQLAHACHTTCDLGAEAYSEYKSMLEQGLNKAAASANTAPSFPAPPMSISVRYFPLHMCTLDSSSFVLPAASAAAALAKAGGRAAGYGGVEPPPGSSSAGGGHQEGELAVLAHSLASIIAQVRGQLATFALGPVSQQVGGQLVTFALGPVSQQVGGQLATFAVGSVHQQVALEVGGQLATFALGPVSQQVGGQLATFAVGPVSQQVALEVSATPLPSQAEDQATSGQSPPSVSLILVDRHLDVVSPCMHNDHPIDIALEQLPRSCLHSTAPGGTSSTSATVTWRPLDVRVDVPPTCSLAAGGVLGSRGSISGQPGIQPGTQPGMEVFNPSDQSCCQRIEMMLQRRQKDALLLLRKWLKEGLRHEKIQPSVRSKAGSVQAAELAGLAQDLMAAPGPCIRHKGTIALAIAASRSMEDEHWEAMASLERQLGLQLSQAHDSSGGLLHVGDVLQLLVMVYSLHSDQDNGGGRDHRGEASQSGGSPFSDAEEHSLQSKLLDAIMALGNKPIQGGAAACLPAALRAQLANGADAISSTTSMLSDFFIYLRFIAKARLPLKQLKRLTTSDLFSDSPWAVTPLLRQLVRRLMLKEELEDVTPPGAASGASGSSVFKGLLTAGLGRFGALGAAASSSAFKGLLTAGLGRFGAMGAAASTLLMAHQSKRKPWDSDIIVLFVVGGVSVSEIREVRQEMEEHVASAVAAAAALAGEGEGAGRSSIGALPHVIVGGTALVGPQDVCRQLLSQ